MPSTVKMGRMPHNNKMKTSRTLETNNMWSKTIGHDPYHNAADQNNLSVQERHGGGESEEFKNLSRLVAKARGEESSAEARSGWKGKRPLKGLFSAGASAQLVPAGVSYSSSDTSDSEDDYSDDSSSKESEESTGEEEKKRLKSEKKRAKKQAKKEKKKAKKERKKAKKKEKKAKKKAKKEARKAGKELEKKRKLEEGSEGAAKKSKHN